MGDREDPRRVTCSSLWRARFDSTVMSETELLRDDRWLDEFEIGPGWTRRIPWEHLRNRPLSPREKRLLREFYNHAYQ